MWLPSPKSWRANSPRCPRIADVQARGVQHRGLGVRFRGLGLYLEETAMSQKNCGIQGCGGKALQISNLIKAKVVDLLQEMKHSEG